MTGYSRLETTQGHSTRRAGAGWTYLLQRLRRFTVRLDSLEAVKEMRMLPRLVSILNISQPLHDMLVKKRSVFCQRLIPPRCSTE